MEKTVLLYLASNSSFYTNLYPQIKKGFEEAGLKVIGGPSLLNEEELIKKIEKHNPCFVFEMNRTKNEIKNFPKEVFHICWLVDFWGRAPADIKGSNILYCWANFWVSRYFRDRKSTILFLPPATDSNIYKPLNIEKTKDFLFLGHIPNKWSEKELNRTIGTMNKQVAKFKDVLPTLDSYFKNPNHRIDSIHCTKYLKLNNIVLSKPIDKVLAYDIFERACRQIRRKTYVNLFANKESFKLTILGTENWLNYEEFADLYEGYLDRPVELNKELSKANILLNDSLYPHFRTFDAMAAKCCVAAPPAHRLDTNAWEDINFIKNEDYIEVNYYPNEIDYKIFKNQSILADIRENAYKKVLQGHLWVHRAEQVIRDVKSFV